MYIFLVMEQVEQLNEFSTLAFGSSIQNTRTLRAKTVP